MHGTGLAGFILLILIVIAGTTDDKKSHEKEDAGYDGKQNVHTLKRFDGG